MALKDVLADLVSDGEDVDRLIAGLGAEEWRLATPAAGWTIAHQVAHLTATFRMAALAAAHPAEFKAMAAGLSEDFDANVDKSLSPYLAGSPQELLAAWREQRAAAVDALASVPEDQVVPWLVRPIPPAILAAAGMMELFGHGQDIADALRVRPQRTDRIRRVVEFGVHTMEFGYLARGLTPPDEPFRFELTAPSGARWDFGPPDAAQRVSGPALDFCLLVTRRRHRDDLAMTASGAEADHWLYIAQAYRGPAGSGRLPGQFAASRR